MGPFTDAIRIKYGKVGPGMYISHLDTIRALERAIRRIGLPVLYSEGFNPRPRMSFAAALQIGVSSKAEHMDVFLASKFEPDELLKRASGAFPASMPLLAAGRFLGGYSLPAKVRRASYTIKPFDPDATGWSCGSLEEAVRAFEKVPSVTVEDRDGKGKEVKGLVFGINVLQGALEVEVACGDRNLRPSDLMKALGAVSGQDYQGNFEICRTALSIDLGNGPQDPMADCVGTVRPD